MTDQELIARLTVAQGDFVTLDHEQAKRCREALMRESSSPRVQSRAPGLCLDSGEFVPSDEIPRRAALERAPEMDFAAIRPVEDPR